MLAVCPSRPQLAQLSAVAASEGAAAIAVIASSSERILNQCGHAGGKTERRLIRAGRMIYRRASGGACAVVVDYARGATAVNVIGPGGELARPKGRLSERSADGCGVFLQNCPDGAR